MNKEKTTVCDVSIPESSDEKNVFQPAQFSHKIGGKKRLLSNSAVSSEDNSITIFQQFHINKLVSQRERSLVENVLPFLLTAIYKIYIW